MYFRRGRNKLKFLLSIFIVVIIPFCQNIIWAGGVSITEKQKYASIYKLAKDSLFDDLNRESDHVQTEKILDRCRERVAEKILENYFPGEIQKVKDFLGIKDINSVEFEIVQGRDESGGEVIRFTLHSESGPVSFYAKFRSQNDLKNWVIKKREPPKVQITQCDPDGDWIKYRIEGNSYEFTEYRNNPTTLEHRITLELSEAGICPPSCVVSDTLLLREIDGISINQIPYDDNWLEFFLEHEEYFIKEIGKAYRKLNEGLGILQVDIKLNHIFITRDGRVYLLDFSTIGEEGPLSSRISSGHFTKNSDLFDVTVRFMTWLGPFIGLGNRLCAMGKDYRKRKNLYCRWLKEGYESGMEPLNQIPVSEHESAEILSAV